MAANMMRPMPSSNGIVKTKPGRDFRWNLLGKLNSNDGFRLVENDDLLVFTMIKNLDFI